MTGGRMKKTDIHVHTSLGENTAGKCSSPEALLDHLKKKGIQKAIIMSTGEHQNRELSEISGQFPEFSWCCSIDRQTSDPMKPEQVFEKLASLKEMGAVGIGELCINEWIDSPLLQAVFETAEKLSMPVTIHMSPEPGYQYGICDTPGLPMLEQTLKKHPHLKILGHSQTFWIEIAKDAPADPEGRYARGKRPITEEGRLYSLFRSCPNLYGDLSAGSGYCAITRDENAGLAFLEEFQDRLLFGTDTADIHSPWQPPLAEWLEEKYRQGKISRAVMEKICFKNAEKLYGIHIPSENTILLSTPCGEILGEKEDNIHVFRGIRYAAAQRWSYPEPIEKWEGCLDATAFGNACFQPRAFLSEALKEDSFYYHEFREDLPFSYSDDCLFLNIWKPEQAENAPVIVFIHGGAFIAGCGNEKPMSPEAWAKKGIVAITVNYRLGPFGFLSFREAAQEAGHTGNYGLYDQRAALLWIQRNISSFGGNPQNVTLMGQSAGAMCVNWHCASLKSETLFVKAVMLSGGGSGFLEEDSSWSSEKAMQFGDSLLKHLGCSSLNELRNKSAHEILAAAFACMRQEKRGMEVFSPLPDTLYYPAGISDALSSGGIRRIPYLLCSTADDLWKEGLIRAGKEWAWTLKNAGGEEVYQARFSRRLPGDDNGAWHSSDLWYWFGSLKHGWRPFTEWDRRLSADMVSYLCEFAKEGKPQGNGLPKWQSVAGSGGCLLEFGDNAIEMGKGEA